MRSELKAVLLVGGKGARLSAVVASRPKPLALVGDRSFLELLVRQLRSQGIRRLVMCSGYLADQIENAFGDGSAWGVSIEYSREQQPLGTAGAVKLAQRHLEGATDFLVMNGDSFVEVDLRRLAHFHREQHALASMVVVPVQNTRRYGTVQVGSGGRVTGFMEKTGSDAPGLVNAGVYFLGQAIFEHLPVVPASLEKDVFPGILELGVYALEQRGMFIDIGTPEDYARAQVLCDRLSDAAVRRERDEHTLNLEDR